MSFRISIPEGASPVMYVPLTEELANAFEERVVVGVRDALLKAFPRLTYEKAYLGPGEVVVADNEYVAYGVSAGVDVFAVWCMPKICGITLSDAQLGTFAHAIVELFGSSVLKKENC